MKTRILLEAFEVIDEVRKIKIKLNWDLYTVLTSRAIFFLVLEGLKFGIRVLTYEMLVRGAL